jgi:general stress protein YciG
MGMSHRFVSWVNVVVRKREAGLSMANSKRGPEPGTQKAKRGGQAVREKYGQEFYSSGLQFYAEIGNKGGESTKRQQGSEFYSRIGKKGGERGRAVASPGKDIR